MKKQDRLDCLSKQQRKIYGMYQSGMKRKDIAKALNLNHNTVVQHIHHAKVRLQQYDRAENVVIKNNQPLDVQLTRADGLVICDVLKDYIQDLRSTVPDNKHEKIGNNTLSGTHHIGFTQTNGNRSLRRSKEHLIF